MGGKCLGLEIKAAKFNILGGAGKHLHKVAPVACVAWKNTILNLIKYFLFRSFLCSKKGGHRYITGFLFVGLSDGVRIQDWRNWEGVRLLERPKAGWNRAGREATCLPTSLCGLTGDDTGRQTG